MALPVRQHLLVGGPFDGWSVPAQGHRFLIPCRSFYADPPGAEPYVAQTVAVYVPTLPHLIHGDVRYTFSHEEVVADGYVAPPPKVKP